MPSDSAIMHGRAKASTLVTGDVLLSPCFCPGQDCDGPHERMVLELVTVDDVVAALTQDDAWKIRAEEWPADQDVHVLSPRPRKPRRPLSQLVSKVPLQPAPDHAVRREAWTRATGKRALASGRKS